jgi:hypothetical protein
MAHILTAFLSDGGEVPAVLESAFQQVVTGAVPVGSGLAKLDSQGDGYMRGASEL